MSQRQLPKKPRRPGQQGILAILTLVVFAVGFWLVGGVAKPGSTASLSFVSPPGTPPPTAQPDATATDVSVERATRQALVQIELTDTQLRGTALPPGVLKPTPTGITSVTPVPTGIAPFPQRTPLGTGALAPIAPPFPSMQFRVTNAWYIDSDELTSRTVVYAGAKPEADGENTQGGVVVYVWQVVAKDNHTITELVEASTYLAPEPAGGLQIIDGTGDRLVLQSADGRTFYFDVSTRHYVSSLAVTVTALPSTTAMQSGTRIP